MHLSRTLRAFVMLLLLDNAGAAQAQTNGIASPIQKITPTGAVTIPQAEVPSVGTLGSVQPHWVFVNRGNGQDGTRIFDGDTGGMEGGGRIFILDALFVS